MKTKRIQFNNISYKEKRKLYKTINNKKRDRKTFFINMINIRVMEKICKKLYNKKLIQGFCHLSIGLEHIYSALKNIIKLGSNKFNGDKVMSSYRCHGLVYITGSSIESIINEMLGIETGLCGGKGGSMHLYNDTFFGGHGIVGSQVGLSVGISFAQKYLKQNNVTFCFLGDGAMNQGQVYESMNLAYIYNLPIIFIIENNGFGMWTTNINKDELFKRVSFKSIKISYNFKAIELISVFKWSRYMALKKGPILIEIEVDRLCGHSCKDEIKKKDPIDKFNEFNDLKHLIKNIKKRININIKNIIKELNINSSII